LESPQWPGIADIAGIWFFRSRRFRAIAATTAITAITAIFSKKACSTV